MTNIFSLINALVLLLTYFTTSDNNIQKLTSTARLSSDDKNYICYIELTHLDFSKIPRHKTIDLSNDRSSILEENMVGITVNL